MNRIYVGGKEKAAWESAPFLFFTFIGYLYNINKTVKSAL